MRRFIIFACLLAGGVVEAAEPLPLRDGDVVAFVGNAFVEREQRDGFLELALTLSAPDSDVTFRNLGWSGDTVAGRARRYFGTTDEGFQHLLTHRSIRQRRLHRKLRSGSITSFSTSPTPFAILPRSGASRSPIYSRNSSRCSTPNCRSL